MEILVLDGKSYVKASKAAKELGYATDYVGQLCRSGQVDAHLIGRTWYVNQDELSTHRTEKKRMSRTKAREYAKKTIEEHREKTAKSTNVYRNIDIQYEHDEQPLLPVTKKLQIKSELAKKEYAYKDRVAGDEMEILNKGKTVVMSGDIKITDVTDGEIDRETTILRPRLMHTSSTSDYDVHEKESIDHEEVMTHEAGEPVSEIVAPKLTFIDRLGIDTASPEDSEETEADDLYDDTKRSQAVRPSFLACFSFILFIMFITLSSLMVVKSISYTHLGGTTAIEKTTYTFIPEVVIYKIRSKI